MTDLVTVNEQAIERLGRAGVQRRDTALRRPLGEVVAETLQAACRSEHTRRAYETALGLFLQYLGPAIDAPEEWLPLASCEETTHESERGRTVHTTTWGYNGRAVVLAAVTPRVLDNWEAQRREQGDAASTIEQRRAAVRTLLRVAYRGDVLSDGQAQRLGIEPYRPRGRTESQTVGRRLSQSEVRALRAAVDPTTNRGKRDLAILDLMLFLGLRAAEVAGLSLSDFTRDQGRWWVRVTGKGDKVRRLKLTDTAYKSLQAWIHAAGLHLGNDRSVWASVNKGDNVRTPGLNTSTVSRVVAIYGHAAGLAPKHGDNRLACHDLRRTAARNAFDNGANLILVQEMLGHASPDTTADYIGAYTDDANTGTDYVRY